MYAPALLLFRRPSLKAAVAHTDRFHEMDPLRFSDGVRVTWRCGEVGAKAPDGGNKCYIEPRKDGNSPVALCEWVTSYGWVYFWPAA